MGGNKVLKIINTVDSLATSKGTLRLGPLKAPKITVPVGKLRYVPQVAQGAQKSVTTASKLSQKTEILTAYAAKNNFVADDVIAEFNEAAKVLDEISLERLLELTQKGEIKLVRKKSSLFDVSLFTKTTHTDYSRDYASPLLTYINGSKGDMVENAATLKQLLALNKEGKITSPYIGNILELSNQGSGATADIPKIIEGLRSGKFNEKNLSQAIAFSRNGFSLNILNARSLDDLTKEELRQLRLLVANKGSNRSAGKGRAEQSFRDVMCEVDTPILPSDPKAKRKILEELTERLTKLTKVNSVDAHISQRFSANFGKIENAFANSAHSVDDLIKAGGIKLSYSREALKENILSKISHLPTTEQSKILEKFGLAHVDHGVMNGLPVHLAETKGLSNAEIAINKEIEKFLFQNKIQLPQGFEGYQGALEEITKTFPEFLFTIGSKQHGEHARDLSGHILKAFETNMKNPLYKTLNETDRRILGVSTLLHDLNKTEQTIDKAHPFISSLSTKAIMERFRHLSVSEQDRIINFVENHHWLERINSGTVEDLDVIQDLAFKFRSGHDFTMAKIFAESDLKAVNGRFFKDFGHKINSPATARIEEEILKLQANGRALYTADITTEAILRAGGEMRTIGTGSETTQNLVIKASRLGLDEQAVIYHAPAKPDAFEMLQSGLGYGNHGVFSATMGKNGCTSAFQGRKQFVIFRRPNQNNISCAVNSNANTGANKDYDNVLRRYKYPDFSYHAQQAYGELSGQTLGNDTYARLFQEISELDDMRKIHSNPNVIKILGGKKEAKEFENAIIKTNQSLTTGQSELVISDPRGGAIGSIQDANEIDYSIRKFCQKYNYGIVEFDAPVTKYSV